MASPIVHQSPIRQNHGSAALSPSGWSRDRLIMLFRATCACMFLAMAWRHLGWNGEMGDLPGPDWLLAPLSYGIAGVTWDEYGSGHMVQDVARTIMLGSGFFYVLCAALALQVSLRSSWESNTLMVGALSFFVWT